MVPKILKLRVCGEGIPKEKTKMFLVEETIDHGESKLYQLSYNGKRGTRWLAELSSTNLESMESVVKILNSALMTHPNGLGNQTMKEAMKELGLL